MTSEDEAERYMRTGLWGYPSLVNSFFVDVQPALIQAREEMRARREIAELERTESLQINANFQHISDENQD